MSTHKIMEIIDENKEKLSNIDYLKLADLLKEKNDEEEKKEYFFISMEYVYPKYRFGYEMSHFDIGHSSQIVQLCRKELTRLKEYWREARGVPMDILCMLEHHGVVKDLSTQNDCSECDNTDENIVSVLIRVKVMGWKVIE